jgi:hypothetical protein
MSDLTAKTARLMRVTDAVIDELDRQGLAVPHPDSCTAASFGLIDVDETCLPV